MATISGIAARAQKSVTITLAAAGGETAWEVETNRAADFSSDESFNRPIAAAGNFAIADLVPDTPYYFRVRKTNAGAGPWSVPVMAATLPNNAPPNPAYNGFSIVPAILIVPEPVVDLVVTNLEPGNLGSNLLNDDPMSTTRIAGNSTAITFRTTGRPIDTFALLGTLANDDVLWRIRGAATAAAVTAAPVIDTGNVAFRISPGIPRRTHYHGFRRLAQTYQLEYWRIDLSGFAAFFVGRNLIVGLARESVNISRGAGHTPIDMGRIERTQFGSPDRVRGWRGRNVEFQLSWLREAEYETKWRDLDQLVGLTDPVLALPNPKASVYLNDRIAFGEIGAARSEIARGDRWMRSLEIRSLY